jgi:hypothetical protein
MYYSWARSLCSYLAIQTMSLVVIIMKHCVDYLGATRAKRNCQSITLLQKIFFNNKYVLIVICFFNLIALYYIFGEDSVILGVNYYTCIVLFYYSVVILKCTSA